MARRAFLTRQRDPRRRQAQALGRSIADEVRRRREAAQQHTAAPAPARAATAPPGDGRVDALEVSAAVATATEDA